MHSHCWCCSIFGGLLRRDDFIDRFALDASEKVDAPTDELTWPFPSENVSANALFHTKLCDALHVESKRTLLHLVDCVPGTFSFTIHIPFGKYFVAATVGFSFFVCLEKNVATKARLMCILTSPHYPVWSCCQRTVSTVWHRRCYAINFVVAHYSSAKAGNAIYAIRDQRCHSTDNHFEVETYRRSASLTREFCLFSS